MSDPGKEARSAYNRRYHRGRIASGRHAEYMRDYYHKRKQRLVVLKAERACRDCGMNDPRCLDFHHRDRETKLFPIGRDAWKVSEKRLLDEVAKCDVLCANCHRISHYEDGLYDSYRASANGIEHPAQKEQT